jgi:hypothetical protein
MASETEKDVRQYLQGVDYPAGKGDLVEAAKSNDAPQGFMERLVDLPIIEYSDPDQVVEALDGSQPPK